MDKNKNDAAKVGFIVGMAGVVAGIFLIYSEEWFIGISGTVASAGLAIKGYIDLKSTK